MTWGCNALKITAQKIKSALQYSTGGYTAGEEITGLLLQHPAEGPLYDLLAAIGAADEEALRHSSQGRLKTIKVVNAIAPIAFDDESTSHVT